MDPVTLALIGMAAYGQWQAGSAQAEASRNQAQLNLLQAEEVLQRNEINNNLILESALSFTGTQATQMAGSGTSLGGESNRRLIANTMQTAAKQIQLNNRTAEWEARMTRLGAASQITAAGQ